MKSIWLWTAADWIAEARRIVGCKHPIRRHPGASVRLTCDECLAAAMLLCSCREGPDLAAIAASLAVRADRLERMFARCVDAGIFVEGNHDWVVYADPPYHPDTLRGKQRYRCKFLAGDHRRLLRRLNNLPCHVLISGYRHPMYDDMLATWRRITYRVMLRDKTSAWGPRYLHTLQYVGGNYVARGSFKKRQRRFHAKVRDLEWTDLQGYAGAIQDEFERRHKCLERERRLYVPAWK